MFPLSPLYRKKEEEKHIVYTGGGMGIYSALPRKKADSFTFFFSVHNYYLDEVTFFFPLDEDKRDMRVGGGGVLKVSKANVDLILISQV